MLKLGDKNISKLYLGDKAISKAYWGDKLIYQAVKPIFLDYVIFDGNSWIDTLFKPNPHTTRTVLDCMLLDNTSSGGQGIFGSRPASVSSINSMNIWFNTSDAPKTLRLDCTGDYQTTKPDIVDITQRLLIDCLDKDATVNGVTYSSTVDKSNTTYLDYSMYLGNFNNGGKPYTKGCKMNVYGFTIYDNGVLIQDLRPCIDPKGTVCMYDMVTKKYFYNQGTGTLTAGNVVKFVDYIHTDGNSYIDTGIALGINHKVSVKVKTPSSSSSAIQLFGNYSDSAGYFTCNVANSIGAISRFDGATYTGDISRSDGNFHTYSLDKNGILIDSDAILNWNKTPTDFQQSDSFYLFRARGSSSVTPNGTQISEEKVWENDTLVQHLKPCVVAGKACFYDMVTGKVFTNAGTGTLKASGRFVESILFDGASWIDTGINKQSCTIECTVKLESTDYRQFLCGWSHIGGYYIAIDTSNRFELGSSAIVTGSNATELSNVVAEHTETEMMLTVNGNYAKRTKQVQTEPDKNYWLGNINSTSYSAPIKGQVRGHKFTSPDGVIIQDLRPYVDENGTACFKDVVTGKLFYNQGTGTLGYTE